MDEYFWNEYKIKLDKNQPLLFVNRNEGEKIYLPSQECCNASLSESFTRNFYNMRTIQPFKVADANTRMGRILALLSKFNTNPTLNDWTVQIEANPIDFEGLMMAKPNLIEKKWAYFSLDRKSANNVLRPLVPLSNLGLYV